MRRIVTPTNSHISQKILWCWVILVSIAYSVIAVMRYMRFLPATYDLGVFHQAIWQIAHGQWPYNTLYNRFIFGDHLNGVLFLLAPLYWIWSDARIVLIFQAIFLTCSTIAIYNLARIRKFHAWIAFSLAFSYSLFYGIQNTIVEDFHPVSIGVGLLAWFLYFFESGKKKWMYLCATLLLFTQENMGLALACIGIIYLFRPANRARAWWLIGIGVIYNIVGVWIVQSFSPIGYEYVPQLSLNIWSNIVGLFDHPEKRQVWMYSLIWFGFLPLFSPGVMIAILIDLWQFFVAGNAYDWMRPPTAYHRSILAIFLVLGVLHGLEIFKKKQLFMRYIPHIFIALAIGGTILLRLPLTLLAREDFYHQEPWMNDARRLFARIPPSYALATQQDFAAYVAGRNVVYWILPKHYQNMPNPCGYSDCWWYESPEGVEYFLFLQQPHEYMEKTGIIDMYQQALINMEKAHKIAEADREGIIVLYKLLP